MLKKCVWSGVVLTAVSVGLMAVAQDSQAQHFGGHLFGGGGLGSGLGGLGGGLGSFGYPGYSGGYGMGNSVYYGNGGAPSYSSSWGYPSGWSNPGYYGNSGWGTTPYHGGYAYPGATYGYGNVNYNWNTPSTAYTSNPTGMYQSFYPPQNNNVAHVTVRLPNAGAELWFDGKEMPERGTVRQFNTPPLNAGEHNYQYHVRAVWLQNGQPKAATRTITVHAGQHTMVDFTQGQTGNVQENQQPNGTRPAANFNQQPGADINQQPGANLNQQPQNFNTNPTPNRPATKAPRPTGQP